MPAPAHRRCHALIVVAGAAASRAALTDHDGDQLAAAALEDRLAPHAQHPAGVVAGAAVHLDELVEQGGLLAPGGAPVPFDGLCGDRLSLTHGKSHLLRPPPPMVARSFVWMFR